MTACAGLSRRRQVNLKKVNLEIDGTSQEQDEGSSPVAGVPVRGFGRIPSRRKTTHVP